MTTSIRDRTPGGSPNYCELHATDAWRDLLSLPFSSLLSFPPSYAVVAADSFTVRCGVKRGGRVTNPRRAFDFLFSFLLFFLILPSSHLMIITTTLILSPPILVGCLAAGMR
eukprot:TRINITY_DN389_c2_g1_i10.p1 TRINITY_DN389_c2_g1~~TRINITY_DN389_c2_g1_i10.p1  ORF type:complete len:112 (+),score=0.06 TRINITY_DN389_c2_g1_i10:714-1049(+)